MWKTLVLLALAASQALARNGALDTNPTVANADLTTHGSDWLWAVFAVMLATAIGITAWMFTLPPGHRAFHVIGIALLFTASIAYFSMASDLGSTPIYVEFVRYRGDLFSDRSINPYTRSIWYVRYIDWVITTPLLLLELLLSTGMPLSGIFMTVFFDEIMIIGGLVGALVRSSYKWGYFTGASVAMFAVFYSLIFPARTNAKAISQAAYKSYIGSVGILLFLWLLYPVAWGLCDGGNVLTTDSEMVFYGVLDILAKPVFLIWHLYSLRKVPYESFGLQSGHYSAYASVTNPDGSAAMNEKMPHGERSAAGKLGPARRVGDGIVDRANNEPGYGHTGAVQQAPVVAAPTGNVTTYSSGNGYNTTGNTHTTGGIAHGAPGTHTNAGQMHVTGNRQSDATIV